MQAAKNGEKINLLIIEDSEYDADLLVRMLRKNNIELEYHLVATEQQMKSHLSRQTYDMVISDFNLPGFSGIEALKIAKKHDSVLPFILISGVITPHQESEILELGADEVILKSHLNRLPFAVRRVSNEAANKKKLKTLNATKDKLISVIAHDLRGTIEGIETLSDFLREDIDKKTNSASLKESLMLIGQTAKSTNQLLENLLNWALLQLDSFQPSFEEIDLRQCIQDAIDFSLSKAAGKDIQIDLNSPPVWIYGDCNMLGIVFRNLISNAIKFSGTNENIDIEVLEEDSQIHVRVKDYGIGMPDEIKQRLFDPNDRPKRQGTSHEQSSGLGLLLCKDAVEMHNGTITVDSEENQGSTFTIHLPK